MSVVDHLEAILDAQRPKQEELWERKKQSERTGEAAKENPQRHIIQLVR